MEKDEETLIDISSETKSADKKNEEASSSVKSLEDVINDNGEVLSLEGKKILWVEDDQFLNDIIARKLTATKCHFFHATGGEEALSIISKEKPDVVMLDIILSGMDGFEILRRIKSNPETKDTPVILLSNLGQPSDLEKGKNLGAEKFLVKATVSLNEIIGEIKELVSKNKKV
jgi:CheY-like chemotaxis protein